MFLRKLKKLFSKKQPSDEGKIDVYSVITSKIGNGHTGEIVNEITYYRQCINGKFVYHRLDGPAVDNTNYKHDNEYYVNGISYDNELSYLIAVEDFKSNYKDYIRENQNCNEAGPS